MKKLFLILVLVVSSFAFDWSGKVNWAMSYASAKKLAQQTHKPIFVDVAASECPPCHYLATKVYTDTKVANFINKHFIPVLIIADKERVPAEVGDYFNGSTPTIMFIKPSGNLFFSFVGARTPQSFYKILEAVNKKYEEIK